jgi:tetratricopeptide (TPR) repeat protein
MCRAPTSGPSDSRVSGVSNLGVAAHIAGASEDGPRYDPTQTQEQRRSMENGIWLCQNHAKMIDDDERRYPSELLLTWRTAAENLAREEQGRAMSEHAAERPGPEQQVSPLLLTSVSGQAKVEQLVTVAHADTINIAQTGASQAPVRASQALLQLPDDISDFVGHEQLKAEFHAHLDGASAARRKSGVRAALYGPPGVGKSALAVHLAHSVAERFPDAQLYVDLGAGSGEPIAPEQALAGFLRALDVEEPYPDSLQERATSYRAQLAGRRALVVLDNASTIAQVRPLLPGSATCAVVVTSRRPLSGLEGAFSRKVDVLEPDQAVGLLGELAGPSRIHADVQAAYEIVRHCGCLPLAVRIAGGRLNNLPGRNLAWLAGRLADERRTLDELELDDQAVRASFSVSYNELSPEEALMFCVLAAVPGPDFSTALAAGAANMDEQSADRLLNRLVEAQLLNMTGEDRFQLHDLLHLFASERLDGIAGHTRQTVADRAAEWLENHASAANLAIHTSEQERPQALAWFEAERRSLRATVDRAHMAQGWELVRTLALNLTHFLSLRGYWDDLVHTHELALNATRQMCDVSNEQRLLKELGRAYSKQARWKDALSVCDQRLEIFRRLRDYRGEGDTLVDIGTCYSNQERWDLALDTYQHAFEAFSKAGERRGEAEALGHRGVVFTKQGAWEKAIASDKLALEIFRELDQHRSEGKVLTELGTIYQYSGRSDEAVTANLQALEIFRALDDLSNEAGVLTNLGGTYSIQKRWSEAISSVEEACKLFRGLGDLAGEGVALANLGGIYASQGLGDQAIAAYRQALEVCGKTGDRHSEGMYLHFLGRAYCASGRWTEGIASYTKALEAFQQVGSHYVEDDLLRDLQWARRGLRAAQRKALWRSLLGRIRPRSH